MPATPATPPPALRPYLTARHDLLWNEADAFAAEHVASRAVRMEAAPGRVERKVADLMATKRWFAVTVPADFGGLGAGHVAKTVLIHRVARVSAAAAAILQATLIPVGAPCCTSPPTSKKPAGCREWRTARCSCRSR